MKDVVGTQGPLPATPPTRWNRNPSKTRVIHRGGDHDYDCVGSSRVPESGQGTRLDETLGRMPI